ncbi:MAG: rRNA ((1402)-2-O)-methyltransferase [Frankiales bacterium]|nr:rRNA ((1402)-2-O)-methyltransferase [Frankiales bacterium]
MDDDLAVGGGASERGSTGRVVLAGAPLGRAADASVRLAQALASTPVVAAEDTRRLSRLAADLGVTVTGRVLSFFEGNEVGRVPQLLEHLRAGLDVLVITDAGMPSVSDPGYRLVAAAVAEGIAVTVLPGPSAVTAAIAVSGLPVDRFCFEGFLPRKSAGRRALLRELANEQRTMVFFESPHRLAESLADFSAVFGPDRNAAVCRELTKTYEEVRRGPLAELAEWAAGEVRGEITLVVAGVPAGGGPELSGPRLAALVAIREAAGQPRKEAIAEVASASGVAKRLVFDAVVAAKSGS